jgi:hypothetical protein
VPLASPLHCIMIWFDKSTCIYVCIYMYIYYIFCLYGNITIPSTITIPGRLADLHRLDGTYSSWTQCGACEAGHEVLLTMSQRMPFDFSCFFGFVTHKKCNLYARAERDARTDVNQRVFLPCIHPHLLYSRPQPPSLLTPSSSLITTCIAPPPPPQPIPISCAIIMTPHATRKLLRISSSPRGRYTLLHNAGYCRCSAVQ